MGVHVPEYDTWESSRGRIEDRFEHIEKSLDAIRASASKLVWIGITAFLALVGHAIVSFIQMGGGR